MENVSNEVFKVVGVHIYKSGNLCMFFYHIMNDN